jgi:hypothetical protein
MGLEAKIKVPAFKNVLKILKAVREEAIIQFNSDGMTVRMVDADRARMIQVRINTNGFSEYDCDSRYELAVVLVRMDDIIKALTAKDDLRLRITDQEDGTFRFALLSNGMERGIKLLNMRLMEGQRAPEWPNFDYVFDATLPADGARSFLKAAKVANDFLITTESDASGNGISWAIRDDREPLVWRPQDVIVNSPNDAVSAYSVEAVNSLVSATVGKQEIRLRGGNDTPVEISWNPHDGIAMAALIANRG